MDRDTQIALGRHLLHCLRQPQDSLQGEISYNDKSIYVDEAQWRQERDVLFRRYPLVAAASCQLRQPGDFVAEDLAGTPVLVVRARDGDVRAFLNVCAHRGAAVVEEPCGEARRTFACPYHGWVYDTDGRLVSIPQQGFGFEGLSLEGLRLVPLPAAERHGLVFVLPDPTGTLDLDAYLGALGPELAGYGFGAYHHFETVVRTPEVNWKLVADGFWEAYHIKVLHKRTIDPIFSGQVVAFDAYGLHHRMVAPRRSIEALRTQPEQEWNVVQHAAVLYGVFPNTVFVVQGDHMEITRIFPGAGPGEAVVHFSVFAPAYWHEEGAREHWQRNLALLLATVEAEDFRVARTIQAGAAAPAQRYQVLGRYEPALAHFHRTLRVALGQPAEVGPPVAAVPSVEAG